MKRKEEAHPPSPRLWRTSTGFTLIEILVVLVIIMILAGIIVGAAKYAQTRAARSRAQSEIATMETALESYKNDNGVYPPSTTSRQSPPPGISGAIEIANSGSLYAALAGGSKVYFTFKPNQLRAVSSTETIIIDPFGAPYNYYRPGGADTATNSASFDLWSYGPDNKNDTADDIVNWRQ